MAQQRAVLFRGQAMTFYGIDPSTQPARSDTPDRDDVQEWAKQQVADFIEKAEADFDKRFGNYGDWDHSAINAQAIIDEIENASWDVVRRSEAND